MGTTACDLQPTASTQFQRLFWQKGTGLFLRSAGQEGGEPPVRERHFVLTRMAGH
jgi:hypothetical protein